jgi:hypothetical protein
MLGGGRRVPTLVGGQEDHEADGGQYREQD